MDSSQNFTNINEFIEYFTKDAMRVDLKKEDVNVYKTLHSKINELELAESFEEINVIKKKIYKAMQLQKERLSNAFLNEQYKGEFINRTAPYLLDLKLFLEYKKVYSFTSNAIENLSKVQRIDKYIQAYNPYIFKDVKQKLKEDGKLNEIYCNIILLALLKQRDEALLSNNALKDKYQPLLIYNKRLYDLSIEIVNLYKFIEKFYQTKEVGYKTAISQQESRVFQKLEAIKEYAGFVSLNIKEGNGNLVILLRQYCINMLNEWIFDIKKITTIDIEKSPLNDEITKIKSAFESAISLSEIEFIQNNIESHSKSDKITNYWEQEIDNEMLLSQFETAVVKIVENIESENEIGCFPMRFRMLPNGILNEKKYTIQRKKYLLKRMFLLLDANKENRVVNELLEHFKFIIEPYSEIYDFITIQPQQIETKKYNVVKRKKIAEKWYALLYWIELSANGEQPPKSREGTFIRSEIEKIGMQKTGTTGQSFYRKFTEIDLNNEKIINSNFGKDWKNIIIELSNNNQSIIEYMQNKYTSNL